VDTDLNLLNLFSENEELYNFQTPDGAVIFRLLPMDRYRLVEKMCKSYPSLVPSIEEQVWDECVVEHSFPSDYRDLDAGIISTVFRIIFRKSGPRNLKRIVDDLQESRDNLNKDIRDQIILKICEAFPSYVPEQIEKMSWATQRKRLAQAESILGTTFEITGDGIEKSDGSGANSSVSQKVGTDGQQYIDFAAENRNLKE
jgi:hypothetical protein